MFPSGIISKSQVHQKYIIQGNNEGSRDITNNKTTTHQPLVSGKHD